jgi:hypothetical protein
MSREMGRLVELAALGAVASLAGCFDLDRLRDGVVDAAAPDDLASSDLASLADFAGVTGSPCADNNQCVGTAPYCIQLDPNSQQQWPNGYCSAACQTSGDTDGGNPSCSGKGYCFGVQGASGICAAACQTANSCRTGYSCFYPGCLPTGYSVCNPSKTGPGACPSQDGGLPRDGGTGPIVCVPAGFDDVGVCVPGCDLLRQDCPLAQICVANPNTGMGGCGVATGSGVQGDACRTPIDCARGFYCVDDGSGAPATCRKLCSADPQVGVGCPNGLTCASIGAVSPSVVGGCI